MSAGTDGLSPRVAVVQMIFGSWAAQAIRAMATLGLADYLAAGPHTVESLARASGTHAPSLARLLRALVGLNLCARDAQGRVTLTPIGELLRSDVAASQRASAQMISAPWVMRVWEELAACVRTGEPVFEHVHGSDFWEYLATHPEDGAGFGAAMGAGAPNRAATLVAACDLSPVGTLVDVGGGQGQQLATVLAAAPAMRGILFDRPEVVAEADGILEAAGVADRCAVVGGDFFAGLPPGGDAYALATIIHDWPDAEAVAILRRCHEAMVPGGRVWLIEQVVQPDRPESAALALLDLNMLLCFGARERTADEYRALLEEAGFAEVAIHPTDSPYSVIEGRRR